MNEKKYFLFQTGQTFGPFEKELLKEMHYKGELALYDLYWDMETPNWKPISDFIEHHVEKENESKEGVFIPPPPTEEEIELIKNSQDIDIPVPPQKKAKMPPPISVILFDQESTSTGKLTKITKNRCFIQSPKNAKRPPFVIGQPLQLNLLSETSQNSINIEVQLKDILFDGNNWTSEFLWLEDKPTELLQELKN